MPRALLSVSDKTGLISFASSLVTLGWTLVASGGTAAKLGTANLPVIEVSQLTDAPEMLGGRVKTLHPNIHAGILARDTQADMAELASHNIHPLDLVVCNLYPFQGTIADPDVSLAQAVENIDIGGVALLRAAAKNFARVAVICDPADYQLVLDEVQGAGNLGVETRRRLAVKAFAHTRDYDTAVEAYLHQQSLGPREPAQLETARSDLPSSLNLSLPLAQAMCYGENPHQAAALYASPGTGPLGGRLLQGKALSYNNMLDLDAAWRAVLSFEAPTVVIVKHLSPCGIACAGTLTAAFPAALASDPISSFGGVIAANREFDLDTAKAIGDLFVEAIAAPGFEAETVDYLAQHKPNCRLLGISGQPGDRWETRSVRGGVLLESIDEGDPEGSEWRTVTKKTPTPDQVADLRMAWKACQHVKSNAIVLAREGATVGIGGGLPSRVDAAELAVRKAGDSAAGSVMASDAFFPFPDGVEAAARAGVAAIVQPGGSVRDEQVIAAADRLGLAMVFTGVRHFRH